jgi:tRNA threonylcarbamoyladenosine biosynthesis protein TsaE
MNYQLKKLEHTLKLAQMIAEVITADFIVALSGDLGAGKTTLVRYILHALGIKGSIKSPTFTYVEPYKLDNIDIYHFDLYRFSNPEDWFDFGFDEYFINSHICFIEWAEKAGSMISKADWQINLQISEEIHNCQILAYTNKGRECLESLMTNGANLFN